MKAGIQNEVDIGPFSDYIFEEMIKPAVRVSARRFFVLGEHSQHRARGAVH
jgi:hypothetical protein